MVDERSNVVPLWMAVVRDAVEKFKAASAEEQDVICVELGQKCGTKAAERKARELFAAARPKPELQYKKVDGVLYYSTAGGGWRRWIGPPPRQVAAEQVKEAKPVDDTGVEGEVIKPSLVDDIGRLELELAEKKAQSLFITGVDSGFMTPGMAAQKPIVALNEMNKKHAVITNLGGKCVVMEWAVSQVDPQWEEPAYQTFTAFKERYSNRYIEIVDVIGSKVQKIGAQPAAAWWLCQPSRRQFDGLDLVPNGPAVLKGNRLNLWRGWGVEPREGDWSKMQQHIWVVLANEERKSFDYIRRWVAWKYQNAGERPEVALNFKGLKGTGKGVFM